jgi:hypothetical protein
VYLNTIKILCLAVFGLLLAGTVLPAEEKSDLLIVRPIGGDFNTNIDAGTDPKLTGVEKGILVVGLLDMPYFSVQDARQVALYGADGKPISLWIEKSSIYSEFDDGNINQMRIAFLIPEADLEKGALRLSWGNSVSSTSRLVDRIDLYQKSKDRYRTFTCEKQPRGNDATNYSSSVTVIVDDKADIYFLWYLLPIVLILVLLIVRKVLVR